jgi:hypothetical protein
VVVSPGPDPEPLEELGGAGAGAGAGLGVGADGLGVGGAGEELGALAVGAGVVEVVADDLRDRKAGGGVALLRRNVPIEIFSFGELACARCTPGDWDSLAGRRC